MKHILYSLCWFCFLDYALNQYVNLQRKPSKSNPCENPNNTALVEHFFNVIFTEFHNTSPVCVCVQMCPDQPTYCYPNGCLKREDSKNKRMNNMQSIPYGKDTERQSMLVVDEKNDFMTDFFKKIDIAEPKIGITEKNAIYDMRPDPFKDKYKMVFKYKKLPKVQLRYNLREQVKNMKSDILKIETLDVSKTRWPMNKDRRLNKQRIYTDIKTHKSPTNRNSYFVSVYPNSNASPSSSKYFKRDLSNKTDDGSDNYVVDQNNTAVNNTRFSLETLIDNLIENSFVKNYTDISLKDNYDDDKYEQNGNHISDNDINDDIDVTTLTTVIESEEYANKSSIDNSENITKPYFPNITSNIIKDIKDIDKNENTINILDGKKDNDSKVVRNTNTYKKFNEMIANLAKAIEKQNNTSMEIMKRMVGDTKAESVTVKLQTEESQIISTKTNDNTYASFVTEDTKLVTQYNELKKGRNRQRLRRKLENSKLN